MNRRYVSRVTEGLSYYGKGLYRRLIDEDILIASSGLAFNAILCLIPLLLLLTSVLGIILSSSDVALLNLDAILDSAFRHQPYGGEIRSFIEVMIDDIVHNRTTFGVFGAVVLTWTASSLFRVARSVLNRVFRLQPRKLYIVTIIEDVLWVIVVGILFMISNALLWVSSLLESLAADIPVLAQMNLTPVLASVPVAVISALTLVMFYILYQLIPDQRIPWRSAALASLTTTFLWIVTGRLFEWYLRTFHSYSKLYGTYTFLLVFLVWIELSCLIFILGGMLGQLHRERPGSGG